jgi:hypothetical protein
MKRHPESRPSLLFGAALLIPALIFTSALGQSVTIDVISKNLSHRILVLDAIEVRLKLLIGFTVTGDLPSGPEGTTAHGVLSRAGSEIASFTMPRLDHFGGNLAFYMPYDIAPGDYDLHIELTDVASGGAVAATDYVVENIERICAREGSTCRWKEPLMVPLDNPPADALGAVATVDDNERGYILWHRNPFKYVYPDSAPGQSDVISGVSARLAQNEYEPATFSLYSLQALDNVTIDVSDLVDGHGATLAAPDVFVVKTVPRLKTKSGDSYELRPRLLEKQAPTSVESTRSQRFWLTIHAPTGTRPGQYGGTITVTTQLGSTVIPLNVEVLPFALPERPDKEYGLMMTYEFQEMTARDLTEPEREKIYDNGVKYYRSFRDHGLTMVFPHSPFVFRRLDDGSPDLRDLEAALRAFEEVGFTGPLIYYCGHLVQSSKPDWAGSSLSFDENRHPPLMQEIIAYARQNFAEMQTLDFYWMPGDEVHDDRGGPDRQQITEQLLGAVWAEEELAAVSVRERVAWPLDIKIVKSEWGSEQPLHGDPWQYPNHEFAPESVDDAESIRRIYGLAHVASEYVGIAPWTFQTTQNAKGDPYTDLDTSHGTPEMMLAYPGTDGPTFTPEYESMREGIDDGKYAYVLETRIESAKSSTDEGLQALGHQAEAAYQEMLDGSGSADLEEMDENRDAMVSWISLIDGSFAIPLPPADVTVR